MKNKILILLLFSIQTFGQVGINTKDLTSSLNITQNNDVTIQDTLLLRVKNNQGNDIFQQKNNGNLTIYNSLSFDTKPGNISEILVSNGNNKSPYWTESIKKGVQIQVFSAQQDDVVLPPDPASINSVGGEKSFTNPNIIIDVSENFGKWIATEDRFVIAKKGVFDVSVGGNFYRTNRGPFFIEIYVYDSNNKLVYTVTSTDNNEIEYGYTIATYGGKNYNSKCYSSTNLIMLLEPGYSIKVSYITGGYTDTFMLADKTYFNVIYTDIF